MNSSGVSRELDLYPLSDLLPGVARLPSHIWIRIHDQRQIRQKLRLSLTEHCNYGCFFCHNEGQGPVRRTSDRSLTVSEIASIARVALAEGVTKIKLTGGEPLLYRSARDDIATLIRRLVSLRTGPAGFDLSLTTNGSLMPEYATRLSNAGLDRVTVSLTTLNIDTFRLLISRNTHLLYRSIAGLGAAYCAGLVPLKVNAVLYHSARRGHGNLGELCHLMDTAAASGVTEFRIFTLLWHEKFPQFSEFYQFFSREMRIELENLLAHFGVSAPVETVEALASLGTVCSHRVYPKVEFGVDLGPMKLGFEAMKYGRLTREAGFQEGPYAIRIAADGALRSTLTRPPSYDVIDALRQGAPETELRCLYRRALEEMP
jgi:molybdenum cofactor biosynthesis enzyme MoaA